jgi:hypothetical protein
MVLLEQMVFSYDKTVNFTAGDGAVTANIPAGDFFNLIDRVEFLSSSRILCTLYSEDILAQLKDLSTDEYSTVSNFLALLLLLALVLVLNLLILKELYL